MNTVAEQIAKLRVAQHGVSGALITPARKDPYLDVCLLGLEGRLYWRPREAVYELLEEDKKVAYRTPEDILRDFRVRGFVPHSG
jgi:hypothetical protein